MTAPRVYTWPVMVETAVCLSQTTAGADTLLLNGTLSHPRDNGLSVDFGDVNRVVSLVSVNNLVAINATITGTLNGLAVSETRACPNATTVYTTQVFSKVTSITVDGVVTALTVGTGDTGHTRWFMSNKYVPDAQLQIQCDVTATLNYSFQTTLDEADGNNSVFTSTPISALTTATTDQLGNYTAPFRYCRIAVNSSNGTGALVTTLLQQGI